MSRPSLPFSGVAAKRDQLLEAVRPAGLLVDLWLGPGGTQVGTALAAEFNIDLALLELMAALAATSGQRETFLAGAIEALPMDRPDAGLAAAWFLDRWADPLERALAGTAAAAPASRIVDLVRTSRVEPVAADRWRAADRDLILIGDLPVPTGKYVDVVRAMAWDPYDHPGMIRDVLQGWLEAKRWDVLAAAGWTYDDYQRWVGELVNCQMRAAERLRREQPESASPEAFAQELEREIAASDLAPLMRQGQALSEQAREAAGQWVAAECTGFLAYIAGTATPADAVASVPKPESVA